MHSGVGLLYQAMHADLSTYKSCFLLSQTDTEKSTTLLLQELNSSFTNIPCFSPKQNAVLSKVLPQRKASKHPEEGPSLTWLG